MEEHNLLFDIIIAKLIGIGLGLFVMAIVLGGL